MDDQQTMSSSFLGRSPAGSAREESTSLPGPPPRLPARLPLAAALAPVTPPKGSSEPIHKTVTAPKSSSSPPGATQPLPLDGNSVVRVRAQVMMRDDSTGGWVPMGGGGLSNVSVRKRKIHHEDDQPCRHEYLIHGKRISDQSIELDEVVLSCTIKKDFEYNKVMPTFHHWKTGNKKFGLTFQTAADARAFDKGVRLAIEDLLDGMSETSPLHQYNMDVGDDDVFMQLDLPVDKAPSSTSPVTAASTSQPGLNAESHGSGYTSPIPQGCKSSKPHSSSSMSSPPVSSGGGGHHRGGGHPRQLEWSSAADQQQLLHETRLLLPPQQREEAERDKDYSYVKFPPRHLLVQGESSSAANHEYAYPRLGDLSLTSKGGGGGSAKSSPSYSAGGGGGGGKLHSPTNNNQSDKGGASSPSKRKGDLKADVVVGEESPLYYSSLQLGSDGQKLKESLDVIYSPSGGVGSGHGGSLSGIVSPPSHHGSGSSSVGGGSKGEGGSVLGHPGKVLTCIHCRESFSSEANPRGSCAYTPTDCVRRGIETVSCFTCAKCLLYHCVSDVESDYAHPCSCSNDDGNLARRWIGLTLLSILVPCLCCYLPLMACYKAGAACKICGGRHSSQEAPLSSSASASASASAAAAAKR